MGYRHYHRPPPLIARRSSVLAGRRSLVAGHWYAPLLVARWLVARLLVARVQHTHYTYRLTFITLLYFFTLL